MIKSLIINNLTLFPEASFAFSPQLNVLVGENGSGKSHLLKVVYSVLATSMEEGRKAPKTVPTKNLLQIRLAEKLIAVLRPETLGRLVRRKQGRERCEITCLFDDPQLNLSFSFATQSKSEVEIKKLPKLWIEQAPVFLPTRELLTIYPGFVSVYQNHYLEFEENWRDTCLLLGSLVLRGPREQRVKELLRPLEEMMEGKVELDKNGRFYLNINGQGRIEMPLVAEGLRKLAMLARLIATGSLLDKGYLFWDEPETNLNPRLIKQIARTILLLGQNGIQIFIATHSLFLLRELAILLQTTEFQSTQARFFGLQLSAEGVKLEQGDTIDEMGIITALDEELSQSDRYLELE